MFRDHVALILGFGFAALGVLFGLALLGAALANSALRGSEMLSSSDKNIPEVIELSRNRPGHEQSPTILRSCRTSRHRQPY
jgi:hypothetical protein